MEIIEYFHRNKSSEFLREMAEAADSFETFMAMLKAAAETEKDFCWIATLDDSPVLKRCYETYHYHPNYGMARSGMYMPHISKLSGFFTKIIAIPMFKSPSDMVQRYRDKGYAYIETHYSKHMDELLPEAKDGSFHFMGLPSDELKAELNMDGNDRERGYHMMISRIQGDGKHPIIAQSNTYIGSYRLSHVKFDMKAELIEIKETQP